MGGVIFLRSPILFFGVFMKNHLKIIIYLMPLLICFTFLKINGYCAEALALNPAFSGFIPFFDLGLNGDGSLLASSDFYEDKLPLELSPAELESINENYYLDNATEQSKPVVWSILSGGNTIPGQSLFARTLTDSIYGNAKAFVLGVKDDLTNTIQTATNKAVFWWNNTFTNNLKNAKEGLEQSGDIVDVSASDIVFGGSFELYSNFDFSVYNFTSSDPLVLFSATTGQPKLVYALAPLNYNPSLSGFGIGTSGTKYNWTSGSITMTSPSNSIGGVPSGTDLRNIVINSQSYAIYNIQFSYTYGGAEPSVLNGINDFTEACSFISTYNPYYSQKSLSYDYADATTSGTSIDIMQLLSRLNNHWVDTDSADRISSILDDGIVLPDTDSGAGTWTLTDELVAELTDVIDDILDQSRILEDELGTIADSGTADPDDPNDDDQNYFDTGIKVPDDFPDTSFDTVNDIISSPLEFFSIFEPIFMIFGTNTLMIFSLWLFVPCVIIIGFIIWALK